MQQSSPLLPESGLNHGEHRLDGLLNLFKISTGFGRTGWYWWCMWVFRHLEWSPTLGVMLAKNKYLIELFHKTCTSRCINIYLELIHLIFIPIHITFQANCKMISSDLLQPLHTMDHALICTILNASAPTLWGPNLKCVILRHIEILDTSLEITPSCTAPLNDKATPIQVLAWWCQATFQC